MGVQSISISAGGQTAGAGLVAKLPNALFLTQSRSRPEQCINNNDGSNLLTR